MKTEGFLITRFLISSSKFHLSSNASLRLLSNYRTETFDNRDWYKKLNLGLKNFKCLDDGLHLYEEMRIARPLPSVIQFTQLLSGVVKLGEYSAAACLFRDYCDLGIPIDEYTMNIAINTYCLSNRVDFGFSILGSFFKRGCVPNAVTFSVLLKGLFAENKGNDAVELLTKIVRERLCKLDVVIYGTAVDGLCKAGGVAAAMDLLRIMEKGSCKPNTHIYSMVIDALCKDKQVDSALNLLKEMSKKEIRANVVTFSSLMYGLCNMKRWGDVDNLLKQMVECKVYPDVVTFSSIIKTLCAEGLVDEAERVLHVMKQQNVVPNVVSYTALMDGYCLQGRLDEARKVFDTMVGNGIAPNVQSFNTLINGFCKKMQIQEAMYLLFMMKRKGLWPDMVTYTLHSLFQEGRCSEARKLFDELLSAGMKPSFHTYCVFFDGLFHNGHSEEALLLLDQLEQKGDVHISYYTIVMNAFYKEKKLDRAREVFNGLRLKGLEPYVVTYTTLINGCCQEGLVDEAKDLVLQMEQVGLSPNLITYNCIARACLRSGEDDDAAKFIEEMVDNGFFPDEHTLHSGRWKTIPLFLELRGSWLPTHLETKAKRTSDSLS